MSSVEFIHAHVDIVKGKTVCVCLVSDKKCDKDCEKYVLTRDRYEGWQKTFRRDKYGR